MHQQVFDKVTTKKEKNNKKKKNTGDWPQFLIDFLFFIPHEKKICTYISQRKNGQTPELAQDDWLESLLAEESESNRCGESFLTPTVTLGHVSLKKHTKHFYCYIFS